jgi:tetratricopeptide (TPR) repeat protein
MDQERKRAANRLYANKQYMDARRAFGQLIRDYPAEKEGYVGLAKVLEVIGSPEEVVATLEPAAKNIRAFSFLVALAGAYRALYFRGLRQHFQNAVYYSEAALSERFDVVTAHYLGDMYAVEGQYERASELYVACHRKGDSGARAKAIECLERLEEFEKIAQLRSDDTETDK